MIFFKFPFIKVYFCAIKLDIYKCIVSYIPAAAAAKSLQLCPTLCDPIDGSPPGSPVPAILQARTLEWDAFSFSNAWKWKVKSENEVAQSCPTLSDPMDCSLPGSSIHGIFQADSSILEILKIIHYASCIQSCFSNPHLWQSLIFFLWSLLFCFPEFYEIVVYTVYTFKTGSFHWAICIWHNSCCFIHSYLMFNAK